MTTEAVHGLDCPRCGGMVPIPEGQVIVKCPYCEQRSVVAASAPQLPPPAAAPAAPPAKAAAFPLPTAFALPTPPAESGAASPSEAASSLGVRRYQAPLRVTRDQAIQALNSFLSGKVQVARDAARSAQLQEAFVVHLPFWAVWGRGVAYAFGQVKVGSGNNSHWEPREKKVIRELTWNSPACEVGEFGVRKISLEGCPLEPFNPDVLHRSGMVFEPVGAETSALEAARKNFESTISGQVQMGRTAQLFTRLVRTRLGVLYYPMWVLRYLYHGRAFQIAVDGVKGEVLYGKAPGSVVYRAAMLVGGMALGAVMAIDLPALILSGSSSSDDNPFIFALIVFIVGLGIMYAAYRTFRYAEHYEYHRFQRFKIGKTSLDISPDSQGTMSLGEVDVARIVRTLEKFQ